MTDAPPPDLVEKAREIALGCVPSSWPIPSMERTICINHAQDNILRAFHEVQQAAKPVWQPIETAPRDGSMILVGFQGQYEWRYFVDPAHGADTGAHQRHAKPTHWQPLPAPPPLAETGKGE